MEDSELLTTSRERVEECKLGPIPGPSAKTEEKRSKNLLISESEDTKPILPLENEAMPPPLEVSSTDEKKKGEECSGGSQSSPNKKGERKMGLVRRVRKTPLRTRSIISGKIKWIRKRGISALALKGGPKEKRVKKSVDESGESSKGAKKRQKMDSLDGTPNKKLRKDSNSEKTEDEVEDKSKTESGEIDDPGEGTSGQVQEDFTKPKQLRKKKVRRNSLRQNKVARGKFLKRQAYGGGKNFKRRKKELGVIVPPTKFLLGGNINDPLNLNSLQDEEINRAMNAATPRSSPLPTPKHRAGEVEVILPRNMKDPLHLKTAKNDAEYMKLLSKKIRKRRKKKRHSGSGSGKEDTLEAVIPVEEPNSNVEGAYVPPDTIPVKREAPVTLPIKDTLAKRSKLDKIVSPVVPQPGAWKRLPARPCEDLRRRKPATTPKFLPRNQLYQYGNYDRYYGYRNLSNAPDMRLQHFMQHPALFVDKDILDIGCNIGHITLTVARDLGARSIVGLDIDKRLIGIARKNVKHYVQVSETPAYCPSSRMPTPHAHHYLTSPAPHHTPHYHLLDSPAHQHTPHYSPAPYHTPHHTPHHTPQHYSPVTQTTSPFHTGESPNTRPDGTSSAPAVASTSADDDVTAEPAKPFFPISMPIFYGPLDAGFSTNDDPITIKPFPHNVSFVQGSYVLESDALLANETPQFDTILCLSVTKWIHLNWGDAGLKRAFRRMFAQLRPGGKLILEAQGWASYKKKKALTEQIYRNYLTAELMPNKFIEYLLSPQVGFTKVEEIGAPQHRSKGFRRAINVLTKPGQTPFSCNTPVCYTPYSQRTCVRRPVYTSLGSEAFDAEEEKKSKDA